MGRYLMILGLVIFAVGVFWQFGARLGLGHLPGDFSYKKGSFAFYAPLGTSLLLSVVLSLVLWLLRRLNH